MKIEIIKCLSDNYSYLIFEKNTNTVSIVDPSEFNACDKVINKYKKLDYILNTHHHADHVDGNILLKKKYNSKIIGFDGDQKRIPGINILLKENQNHEIGNLFFKVIFIPGHTKGHIAFYFEKEKVVFTGDTLFSLGCGRIFEGTYSQMYNSLMKLKNLPENTKVFCGHEYTKQNSNFCILHDKNNKNLKIKINDIDSKLKNKMPTIPSTIKDELECNIFFRSNSEESFSKLRDLKDNF